MSEITVGNRVWMIDLGCAGTVTSIEANPSGQVLVVKLDHEQGGAGQWAAVPIEKAQPLH